MQYAGKFVFVQAPLGDYYGGEYFVLQDSVGCFYGIQPIAGYEGSNLRRFDTIGKKANVVLAHETNWPRAQQLAHDLEEFSKEREKEGEKQWVKRVYFDAANNVRMIQKLLEKQNPIAIDWTSGAFLAQHRELCKKLKNLIDQYTM